MGHAAPTNRGQPIRSTQYFMAEEEFHRPYDGPSFPWADVLLVGRWLLLVAALAIDLTGTVSSDVGLAAVGAVGIAGLVVACVSPRRTRVDRRAAESPVPGIDRRVYAAALSRFLGDEEDGNVERFERALDTLLASPRMREPHPTKPAPYVTVRY